MNPFTLGRMRHLDLLALWLQTGPSADKNLDLKMARLSANCLAAAILTQT